MNFERAFELIIGHEGGYVNDPRDPGGETNYGITRRSYPGEDIAGMTLERAREIYQEDYWDKCRCGEMPWGIALCVFDCAVNQGRSRAVKLLQTALKVSADGVIGPRTLAAVNAATVMLTAEYQALRMLEYVKLPTWPTYQKGWTRRAFATMIYAVEG